ncbi:hypothetical protein LMIY3S_01023 [Labrys miyagiensis]
MDAQTRLVMEECSKGSAEGRLSFPDVVMKLSAAGVEMYHADFRRSETTYYMPDDASHVVAVGFEHASPARQFGPSGVEAAIRAIQARRIDYRQFCEAILAAGCVGYFVSLSGRRAIYFGRGGESFVEPFPQAA